MSPMPVIAPAILRVLRADFPEGATAQELADTLGVPYISASKALKSLLEDGGVERRKGKPAEGGKKPPMIYSAKNNDIPREEIPVEGMPPADDVPEERMPQVRAEVDPTETDEGEIDPPESPGEGHGEGEATYDAHVQSDPEKATPVQLKGPAATAMQHFDRREVVAGQKSMEKAIGHEPGKLRKVERVHPLPNGFPEEELGVLSAAFEEGSVGDLTEYISGLYGGGTYKIHPCNASGNIFGGLTQVLVVQGVPKPRTAAGRNWVAEYEARNAAKAGGLEGGNGKMPDMMAFLEIADRKAREARNDANTQFQQTLQLLAPKPEAATASTQALEALRTQHREELQKAREEGDKRVADLTKAHDVIVKKYEEDVKALREEIRNTKTDLTNAWTKEKADLQVAHLAKVAEIREAHQKEIQAVKEQATKDLAAAKAEAAREIRDNKKYADLESQMKALQAGPGGIQAEVNKGMIPTMIKIATEQAKLAAGIGDEGPETMMDALKEAVVEAGPDVMKRVASGIMSIIEKNQGVAPAQPVPQRPGTRPQAIPQRPGAPRLVPPPTPRPPASTQMGGSQLLRSRGDKPSAPLPPPPPPRELTEEEQMELIRQRGAPAAAIELPGETVNVVVDNQTEEPIEVEAEVVDGGLPAEVVNPVEAATANRLRAFFEAILTELQIDSDAAATWLVPIPDAGMTLEDLYFKLPGKIRRAMEAAPPEEGWKATLAALGVTADADPLLQAIQEHIDRNPDAVAWMTDFFDAGPWNEEPEEEEEEEEEVPGQPEGSEGAGN